MSDRQPAQVPRALRAVLVLLGVVVALGSILGIAFLFGGKEPIPVIADVLTAAGTLALAWYTFELARATQRSVREAADQMSELEKQRVLLERQADTAAKQAEIAGEQAAAARATALATEKSRVDAIAPLLYLEARIRQIVVVEQGVAAQPVGINSSWKRPVAILPNLRFDVAIIFTAKNVGAAPARVSFGGTSWYLENRRANNLTDVVLEPGEQYSDRYIDRLFGEAGTAGHYLKMPFTYSGIMHGEMFDLVQWNGWITPVKVDGMELVPHDLQMNSSGAQVMREYPNIERPDEMAAVRKAFVEGNP